jgi:hypothetical protein
MLKSISDIFNLKMFNKITIPDLLDQSGSERLRTQIEFNGQRNISNLLIIGKSYYFSFGQV